MSAPGPRPASPREDGELSDDSVRPDSPLLVRHRHSSYGHPQHQYRSRPDRLPPPPHGYRPKVQYRPPPRMQQPPPMGDCGPRPSFWERSHDTLDRFRSRGRGRHFWDREWGDRGVKPSGQRGSNCGWLDPCPRKIKSIVRSPPRKSAYFPKNENCEESFEDLLLKYKQIKLELESINKDEKLALKEDHAKEERVVQNTVAPPVQEEKSIADETVPLPPVEEKIPVKTFQAFELKPLRQKLKPITEPKKQSIVEETSLAENVNEATKPVQVEPDKIEQTVSSDSNTADEATVVKKPVAEEEELSELHLRLLALQSASKKWHQKEQLVMKESKEKLSKGKVEPQKEKGKAEPQKEKGKAEPQKEKGKAEPQKEKGKAEPQKEKGKAEPQKEKGKAEPQKEKGKAEPQKKGSTNSVLSRKVNNAAYAAKQALRRQQTKAWKKLQQQKAQEQSQEEEEKKNQGEEEEEEERRKREEEIRKIRDLSNQEEQYNRFMKLVGDKTKRSKSFDGDQKRSDKHSLESSGSIYQYDNYEEVAMDTDSETNSPGASPTRLAYSTGTTVGCVPSVLCLTEQFPSEVWPRSDGTANDPVSRSSTEVPLPLPPLPPEEPEQPPKPPFADEEEEEEMLLREELLKSLANKRAHKPEEPTNSQPPSPPHLTNIMPVPRITLTSTSVNSASHRKTSTQLVRVLRPLRRVIKLPKHKSVVVTLNASDDSESDGEPTSPGLGVFGGLESMIREARRTVEASKPKAPSISEKENDPMRTPEALPDDKKMEYRLLKEEIASREKQKLLKTDQSRASSSPTNSDLEVDGIRIPVRHPKVTEAESRHLKQKILLLKDESLLKNLLQQEDKKKESIKTAELKITRLSEQLQATEKFLNANRVFLKRLQEQIVKVQHRVKEKRSLALKYGEEIARAKALASQELGKRKLEPSSINANKMFKPDNSLLGSPKRHSTEAIALEKKRLQELEKEYALKIQKLKEMQARKVKEQVVPQPPVVEEQPEYLLPQPSLHDLSQDKITLDTEDNELEDEDLSISVKERRRSFRDSNSFTKPNLKHTELTPYKESSSKPSKMATEGPELFLGLNIEDLRRLHSSSGNLTELLSKSDALLVSQDKLSSGKEIPVDVEFTTQTKQIDARASHFGPYRSPLLVFKSYRFSPYFRTKEKLLLSSVSYSNMIEPKTFFCRFDLTGTCNDDDCQWQHMRDCTLSRKQLFQDILSYNLDLIGCSEKSTDEEIMAATEKYVDKLFGVNRDRMPMDLMSVLLVSYVNESRNHTPPHTTCKEKRKWKPMYWKKPVSDSSSSDEDDALKVVNCARLPEPKTKVPIHDAVVTQDDVRYFTNETDDISNLEASVLENPQDIQLWIKLAYKCLNQNEGTSSECLDSSLNVLSRALEHNRDNPEVWSHYLKIFSKRGTTEEIQEMCETAVEYAPSYQIWWMYLTLMNFFDGKDEVCSRTLQHLMHKVEEDQNSELLSLQCLEMLLYRVHLNLYTGRLQNALAILQNALKSPCEKSIADHLTPKDRCLAWLSYIHLMEFSSLPNFYDPTAANPSRIVNKEPFLIPWLSPQSVTTDPVMLLALFEAAVFACSDENLNANDRIEVCLPLYKNMISLHLMLNRHFAAVNLCKQLLKSSSSNSDILEALCSVYIKIGQPENAMEVWMTALRNNPGNAQIFYYVCKFLVEQGHIDCTLSLMEHFVVSFFENIDEKYNPTDLLRHLLNFTVPLNFKAPACKVDGPLSVSNIQTPYLWLVFCLWQSVHTSTEEAADAYEAALGAVMQQDMLQKLWLDYLVFTNSKIAGSRNKVQDSKHFTDLVNRCLMTVPTRHPTPFSTADYWTNYEFHNSVIYFYLSCVPKAQHSRVLERFSAMMPTNLGLALRVLKQELEDNNIQIVKMQSKMFTYNFPMCLSIWKIAIAVETSLKGQKEVHHLYQRALQKLPLCAELWKDQLLFEASGGGKSDNLRKLVSKCQEIGVSLDELLNLNTESKNR